MPQDHIREGEPDVPLTGFRSTRPKGYDDVMSALVPVGVLGGNDRYNMPAAVLTAMARHLGGDAVRDMPPFFIACTDGMALVLTIRHGEDYMGGAVFLSSSQLARLDRGIADVWARSAKTQTVEEFFKDTAFKPLKLKSEAPTDVESNWRFSFC